VPFYVVFRNWNITKLRNLLNKNKAVSPHIRLTREKAIQLKITVNLRANWCWFAFDFRLFSYNLIVKKDFDESHQQSHTLSNYICLQMNRKVLQFGTRAIEQT
jgi:hypothetical protein